MASSTMRMQALTSVYENGHGVNGLGGALHSNASVPHFKSDGTFTLLPPFVSPKQRAGDLTGEPFELLPTHVPPSASYMSSACFTFGTSTTAVASPESWSDRLDFHAPLSTPDAHGIHPLFPETKEHPQVYSIDLLAFDSISLTILSSLFFQTMPPIVADDSPRGQPCTQTGATLMTLGHFKTSLQQKFIYSDYVKSLRDIRAEPCSDIAPNGWLIEEESLVIGVDPSYVVPTGDDQPSDELDLQEGKLFVVEQIFSDMWALCSEISTSRPHHGRTPGPPNKLAGFGFVPLCAVTLAANYGTFLKRCREYQQHPDETILTPANGGRVLPPVRVQSVHVSREMDYWSLKGRQYFKTTKVHAVCQKFRPIGKNDDEWEPRDPFDHIQGKSSCLRRVWRKLKAEKLNANASWAERDSGPRQGVPNKKTLKGLRRDLNVKAGIRDLCGWIRGH
ncbi:hypothetical protein N7539_006702 [Penicillium diatomitis]|uniref:Uncharacterized protein n=1 Tax=Penicillium diatomitis TaxID=2819901 RepID=A0A9W9X1T6_9EURO|nr:uncharacterized protein N7539_006702 [Penicillium diatomitis]KAJ5480808.1 hypothetical protein N7539_006702 [Penicillium diatomitis]